MIISLTGFMGCGKSSVGRRLSELLCRSFVDLDDEVVRREGRSIPEIFATEGEPAFRQMELEALKAVLKDGSMASTPPNDIILALGGGTVMTAECAEIVHEKTLCIYLKASVETLLEHLEGEAEDRPILSGDRRHRIETLMQHRTSTYEKTAHITIDTDGRSIEAIASDIISISAKR